MAAADGHHQRHQRHRRSRTAHLGAHLLAFAAAGVAAPADSAVSAARGGISLSRSLPQLLPVDLVGNHQFHELRLQQHSSAQAGGYMSAAAVPSLSSVSDSTPAYAGWPVHGLAGSGGSAPATSAATSTSSSSRHSLHSPLSQPSLHSRYLLTGGAEAVLNSPRRQRFSTGSGFGPPLPVLPPPPLSSAPSASSAFADPTQAEALAQAHRRPRALSYGSGSFGLEEENSGGGSGGSGTHTALVPRISAPTLDAFGSVSDAPMLTPAPPSAPLPACGSGSGSPRSAPAAAAVIVGGGPRSSRSSASRPQSRLLRVSRPNSPLPGYENSGGVGSTGFAAAWAAGGAGAASCRGGDVGTAGAGAVDELAYGMDMQGHEGGNNCELLAPLPSSPRFGPGGRGGAGSLPDAASEFGQGASGAGSGVAGAGVGGTATAVPLRRLCSAAVAALAAAAEATASESDTPSEITCKVGTKGCWQASVWRFCAFDLRCCHTCHASSDETFVRSHAGVTNKCPNAPALPRARFLAHRSSPSPPCPVPHSPRPPPPAARPVPTATPAAALQCRPSRSSPQPPSLLPPPPLSTLRLGCTPPQLTAAAGAARASSAARSPRTTARRHRPCTGNSSYSFSSSSTLVMPLMHFWWRWRRQELLQLSVCQRLP